MDVAKSMGVDIVIAVDVGFRPVARKEFDLRARGLEPDGHDHDEARDRPAAIAARRQRPPHRSRTSRNDAGHRFHGDRAADRPRPCRDARKCRPAGTVVSWTMTLGSTTPPRAPVPANEQAVVHFVRTDKRSERYSERIQAELGPVIGQPLDPEEMDERLSHFYGSDNFEALDYRLVRDGVLTGIEVSARQQELGPEFPALRARAAERLPGRQQFQRRRAGAGDGGEPIRRGMADRPAGRRQSAASGPSSTSRSGTARTGSSCRASWSSGRTSTSSRANAASRPIASTIAKLEFDFGREFGSWGELRAGIIRGNGNRHLQVGDPDDPGLPPRTEFDRGEFMSRFSVDLLDDVYFPRHGDLVTLQWNGPRENLGADANADRFSFDWTHARSWNRNTLDPVRGRRRTCLGAARTRCRTGTRSAGSSTCPACRPTRSTGRSSGSRARSCTGASATARKACSTCRPTSDFRSSSATSGNGAATSSVDSALFNGSAFVGFDTFLGPIYVAAGFGEGGDRTLYLLLGRIR